VSAAPAIKFCGLTRRADAELACAAGAAYLGVILAPGGRRTLSAPVAAEVVRDLPAAAVGVFVDQSTDEVCESAESIGLGVLQLHGAERPGMIEQLRARGPWRIWKAVRPRTAEEFLAALEEYAGVVDALLLDGWSAAAPGGTGARFPWEVMAPLRERVPAGVALVAAGGMRPENVAEAIRLLSPDVVDVSSGVETAPGEKSAALIREFAAAVRVNRSTVVV
jgi:phosphoribosylanthranilate isomerase